MYAIIETGGKQYRVCEGDVIATDLHDQEVGSDVTFDNVVLASNGKDDIKISPDALKGVSVAGTIVAHGRAKKILVFRYKAKKRVRKLNGHRQPFAKVKITKISL
jgi:large subunit ribosomal protein L21